MSIIMWKILRRLHVEKIRKMSKLKHQHLYFIGSAKISQEVYHIKLWKIIIMKKKSKINNV